MNRLKDLREEKDLKQRDVSEYLNMSQNGYSQYETEVTDIPTDILKKLAAFHNTSIDYLLFETDIRERYPKSKIK